MYTHKYIHTYYIHTYRKTKMEECPLSANKYQTIGAASRDMSIECFSTSWTLIPILSPSSSWHKMATYINVRSDVPPAPAICMSQCMWESKGGLGCLYIYIYMYIGVAYVYTFHMYMCIHIYVYICICIHMYIYI